MLIKNLLYILQIEGYMTKKFLRFSYAHLNWWNLEKRGKLVWTNKARLIYLISIALFIAILILAWVEFRYFAFIVLILDIALLPSIVALSLQLIAPIDWALKKRLIKKAKILLENNRGSLIVIGVTGSYGKTSTKEILTTILREKFRVVTLEENINTDLGIAEFIVKNMAEIGKNDVFVVEMGAYKMGEIKNICEFVRPDYGIISGIAQCHMERFGSLENIISAKFELALACKKKVYLNFDDENIKQNYAKFKLRNAQGTSKDVAKNVASLENFGGISFELEIENKIQKFQTRLLAFHNISLILLAVSLARELGLTFEETARGAEKIEYIKHRLEPIYNSQTGIWVIDDSYNGNLGGIISGVEVLSRAQGRKVVLTPGLVELGEKTKEIHQEIGELYVKNKVDLILLIKNKATAYIVDSLKSSGFENYKLYSSTNLAHKDLPNVLKSGDTIIFQNDLPDNYF